MKKILLTILSLFAFTFSASAASLTDALKITFQNNLELKAERKNLEVQREVLNISKSDFFPMLTLSGTKNFENTNELTNQSGADASIAFIKTSCSFLISFASERFSPNLLFSYLVLLALPSIKVCSNFTDEVIVSVSVIEASAPL